MNSKELLIARVIIRKIKLGESLENVLLTYPLLIGESLERVVEYVGRNN